MAAQRTQINMGKENLIPLQEWGAASLFYYSQVYLRSLPDQLMDQQYHHFECMWGLKGNSCFVTFCTLGNCLVLKKVPNKHINQISLI